MLRRVIVVNLMTVSLTGMALVGCGGDGDGDGGGDAELTAAGAEGKAVYDGNGCASCHGINGQGDLGPELRGLYGTEVELDDGTTVTADDAYLTRAIAEPDAERVDGFEVAMPVNGLDDTEIAQLIAWMRDIGPSTEET